MLTKAFEPRGLHLANIVFNDNKYDVVEITVRKDQISWLESTDLIIDVIFPNDMFARDYMEWLQQRGGDAPQVELNAFIEGKAHKVQGASVNYAMGNHATLIGGTYFMIEHRQIEVTLSDDYWDVKNAQEKVRKMKSQDPLLARFEIELED